MWAIALGIFVILVLTFAGTRKSKTIGYSITAGGHVGRPQFYHIWETTESGYTDPPDPPDYVVQINNGAIDHQTALIFHANGRETARYRAIDLTQNERIWSAYEGDKLVAHKYASVFLSQDDRVNDSLLWYFVQTDEGYFVFHIPTGSLLWSHQRFRMALIVLLLSLAAVCLFKVWKSRIGPLARREPVRL